MHCNKCHNSRMTDPFRQFAAWFEAAQAAEPDNPEACALATVDMSTGEPRPDVRIVLLKEVADGAFHFYTNRESAKGRQLAAAPHAALDFHWKSLKRQVRVGGPVALLPDALSDAYFATRPRNSQLSAWASIQSQPLDDRATFESRLAEADARFPAAVPRPPFWGGYGLYAARIEFWEERPGRQHHREQYLLEGGLWAGRFLYP